jgi:hypothetical protein
MQKMTIVKPDNLVYIDGVHREVDCSDLPENLHAIVWYEDMSYGEIQWAHWPNKENWPDRPLNTEINALGEYYRFVERWNAAAPPPENDPV